MKTYSQGSFISITRYIYYEDGTVKANTYEKDKLIKHQEFDSSMNLLYQMPVAIPKITHTTYKFRSGRTYFDRDKIDTIEILNDDFPPYNKAYTVSGASLVNINNIGGIFAITTYRKSKNLDTIKIWLSVRQDISLSKPISQIVDSVNIPVR